MTGQGAGQRIAHRFVEFDPHPTLARGVAAFVPRASREPNAGFTGSEGPLERVSRAIVPWLCAPATRPAPPGRVSTGPGRSQPGSGAGLRRTGPTASRPRPTSGGCGPRMGPQPPDVGRGLDAVGPVRRSPAPLPGCERPGPVETRPGGAGRVAGAHSQGTIARLTRSRGPSEPVKPAFGSLDARGTKAATPRARVG